MFTTVKATLAGSVFEVKQYQKAIEYGFESPHKSASRPKQIGETTEFARQISNYRSKRRIRQLIYANAYRWKNHRQRAYKPVFVTFTFADNIQDPKQANKLYTAFVQRINYQLTKSKKSYLKYLAVVEFQKRGAVHYHVVFFNLPYYHGNVHKFFADTWQNGFVKVNAVNDLQHLANYVAKYLTKNDRDERLDGKKYYFSSKGLHQPKEIYKVEEIVQLIKNLPPDIQKNELIYNSYDGQKIIYTRYKLPDTLAIQK